MDLPHHSPHHQSPRNKKRRRTSSPVARVTSPNKTTPTLPPSSKPPPDTPPGSPMPEPDPVWIGLDLILALENKEGSVCTKIELAFDYVSGGNFSGVVPMERVVECMNKWVQSVMVKSSEEGGQEACLDVRCWRIFGFCLREASSCGWGLSFSANLLRPIARIARHLLMDFGTDEAAELACIVSDCVSVLFSNYARSVNANMNLWATLSAAAVDLACAVLTTVSSVHGFDAVLSLCTSMLEPFVSYLKVHPNPKSIFTVFVDRVLEPMLILMTLPNLPTNLLRLVEDVLSDGLFHPAHIDGFLEIRSSDKYLNKEVKSKRANWEDVKSYHKHLFRKLEQLASEKKKCMGHLFQLFLNKAKKHNQVSLAFGTSRRNSEEDPRPQQPDQEKSKAIFEVFVQFAGIHLNDVNGFPGSEASMHAESVLPASWCSLLSMNKMLISFVVDKVYFRTEDAASEAHYEFLKNIFNMISSFSSKLNSLLSSALVHGGMGKVQKLVLTAKEVAITIGCLLEIEYRVVEEDLMSCWIFILLYLAIGLLKPDSSCVLVPEVLRLGCQLVNVYSELRQVERPFYALCEVVRSIKVPVDNVNTSPSGTILSLPALSSEVYAKSVETLISSKEFRQSVSAALKLIPEGHVGEFIQKLRKDIEKALEWIKPSSKLSRGSPKRSKVDLSLQIVLLGKVLSELYLLVLDSLVITTGNSIIVGNSIKDLMSVIQPSLSTLVHLQSNNTEEFLFSVLTSKRMYKSEFTSWVFVFYFRIYLSSRSLYRQTISLMPPGSSRKASAEMGCLFAAHCGQDWVEKSVFEDDGYFSWIIRPSVSLLTIINLVKDFGAQGTTSCCASLVYLLHAMAIQRIIGLNRLIKACEFFQHSGAGMHISRKKCSKWKVAAGVARQEAAELTEYVTEFINAIFKEGKEKLQEGVNDGFKTIVGRYNDNAWDFCISTLSEDSLPAALWCLLCQNIDVWCAHSSKMYLKKFLSLLFWHSLLFSNSHGDHGSPPVEESRFLCKASLHFISMRLLTDTMLYEQTFLCRLLISRFNHVLKQLLVPILSADVDLNALPDWSTLINILSEASSVNYRYSVHHGDLVTKGNCSPANFAFLQYQKSFGCMEVAACRSLLNMICWMPKRIGKSRSWSTCMAQILNIERIVLLTLLNSDEDCMKNCYELFRLFLSCRRAMRHIIVSFVEKGMHEGQKLILPTFVNNSLSLVWLSTSISVIIGLTSAISEMKSIMFMQEIVFPLIDHTSHIFFRLTKFLSKITFQSRACEQVPKKDHELDSQINMDIVSNSLDDINTSNVVKFIAESLKGQMSELLGTFKANVRQEEPNWNQLSSCISCFLGFLYGVSAALKSVKEINASLARARLPTWKFNPFFNLNLVTDVFEDVLSSCLSRFCLEDHPENGNICGFSNEDMKVETALMMGILISGLEFPIEKNHGGLQINFMEACGLQIQDFQFDKFGFKLLDKSLLKTLLEGERLEMAFCLRQLFIASGAILQLKFLSPKRLIPHKKRLCRSFLYSVATLSGILNFVVSEFADTVGKPHHAYFICLDGITKYLEALGSYFSLADPVLSRNAYGSLISIHLKVMGKCISLQGKLATLVSHEMESTTKSLEALESLATIGGSPTVIEKYCLNELKAAVRSSFKVFVRKPSELHVLSLVQALERALLGVQGDCCATFGVSTGNFDGGQVSPVVGAGIDFLDLLLESVLGNKKLAVVKNNIQNFVSAVLNIVLHLQNPQIFCQQKISCMTVCTNPDPGSIVLMCVELLTRIAGKPALFTMDSPHVGQCLHMPAALFRHFSLSRGTEDTSSRDVCLFESQFSVALYAACCRLLCTIIRHRKSEYERCICLLEDSICRLLYCLETGDAVFYGKKRYFSWELHEAVMCASFLRRVYEEVRQQKDILGKYCYNFLSDYIVVYSGYGPHKTGIRREIAETLRPGIYAIIDVCSPDDLQYIHTVLEEGTCRGTLATLQHDYKLKFQYEGKV